jgi:soluble lytic murein transglycosylase
VVALLVLVLLAGIPLAVKIPESVQKAIYPLQHEQQIRQSAQQHGLEPAFLAAVIYAESRFNPQARSSQNAYGLMQIVPQTAQFISQRSGIQGDYRDPQTNIRMGAWYISYLQGQYPGNERLVLAAYNSGEGQVERWLAERGPGFEENIPFQETQNYVQNVQEAQEKYREIYGRNLNRD